MRKMETPRRQAKAVSGELQAGKLDEPEHKRSRKNLQSIYRRRPVMACAVKVAILRAGGRVKP